MIWEKIRRTDSGFVDEKCLDFMFDNLPIVVEDSSIIDGYEIINDDNADDMRGEIDRNINYTRFLRLNK